jgi:hypothetical protein
MDGSISRLYPKAEFVIGCVRPPDCTNTLIFVKGCANGL